MSPRQILKGKPDFLTVSNFLLTVSNFFLTRRKPCRLFSMTNGATNLAIQANGKIHGVHVTKGLKING